MAGARRRPGRFVDDLRRFLRADLSDDGRVAARDVALRLLSPVVGAPPAM